MSEAQPYTINGIRFVHDDRGRYCPQGGVAWLRPSRASKIIEELRDRGVTDALTPVDETIPARGRVALPPSQRVPHSAPGLLSEEEGDEVKPDLAEAFLRMHHTRRKKLARLLGAKGKLRAADVKRTIRNADPERLEAFKHLLED